MANGELKDYVAISAVQTQTQAWKPNTPHAVHNINKGPRPPQRTCADVNMGRPSWVDIPEKTL